MPTKNNHIKQANHNDSLLGFLKKGSDAPEFADWYVTVAYYSAVHHVEAMFAREIPKVSVNGKSNTPVAHSDSDARDIYNTANSHEIRLNILKDKGYKKQFFDLFLKFRPLYTFSHIAKYHCHDPRASKWILAETNLQAVRNLCRDIRL